MASIQRGVKNSKNKVEAIKVKTKLKDKKVSAPKVKAPKNETY